MEMCKRVFFNNSSICVSKSGDGDVLFNFEAVANKLGYSNPEQAVRDHVDDCYKKKLNETDITSSLRPDIILITEPGLYNFLMTSEKPLAQLFQQWFFKGLPTLDWQR